MPTLSEGPIPARRQSAAGTVKDDDVGLTQSLSQLSLTNEPTEKKEVTPGSSTSAALQAPALRPSSASPRRRQPSRSPSHGPPSRTSRGASPALVRKSSLQSLHSSSGIASSKPGPRRASAGHVLTSVQDTDIEEEKPPVTANSIAKAFFTAEVEAHHGPISRVQADTVVILSDAVYGHRFSRPRTSRNSLSTIVERPERIKASVLGVSAAYVRLGGHYCEGSHPIHPSAEARAVQGAPFRIHKTLRTLPITSPAVTNVHGTKWMEELKIMCESAESVLAMGGKELQRPDVPRGPEDPEPAKLHEGDLYLCAESLEAIEGALGAVCEAVDVVFTTGPSRAFVGVRPPGHHCSASYPSGFCWINNVHVGIMHGALNHNLTHAAIIDFDLHHGDGSQAITWAHNSRAATTGKREAPWRRTSIGYFSLHDINSYPCEMGDDEKVKNASLCIDNAHGQSIWNVHLQSWKTEQDFWVLYETKYGVLLEKTRNYLRTQAEKLRAANVAPKAAIFLSAGFDASEWESAGMQRHQVNVPTEFYARLTRDVVKLAAEEGLCVNGRVISVLEGGYSDRALSSGVMSHLSGMVGERRPSVNVEEQIGGLGYEMSRRMGAVEGSGAAPPTVTDGSTAYQYDPSWWASSMLDKLDRPAPVPSPPRKPRNATPPTYSSPTQASAARVVDPANMRRSLSGVSTHNRVVQRPPSPSPPPEVSWEVAATELSKVLIPSNRQVNSCRAEELNAEASRARRDRQSILLGLPPTPSTYERPHSKMALRERKSRPIMSIDEELSEVLPKTRRKASTPSTSPVKGSRNTPSHNVPQSARRTSRRLSGTSATMSPPALHDVPPVPPIPTETKTASRPNSRAGRSRSRDRLAVKKTRAEASARKEPGPKGGRSTKKSATPARGIKQPSLVDTPTPANGLLLDSMGGDDNAGAVDNLASGVKKIRINLITQSQKAAKRKAQEDTVKADESIGEAEDTIFVKGEDLPTPAGMSSIPKKEDESGYLAPGPPPRAPPTPSLSAGMSTPVDELYASGASSPTPAQFARTGSSAETDVNVQPSSDGGEFFIPYQPEGPDQKVAVSQQEPLKWLPPNVPTPSAATPAATPSPAKKSALFHYTSGIPFAPRGDKAGDKKEASGMSENSRPELKATAHSLWKKPGDVPK